MNKHDEIIFDLLRDLKGILDLTEDYPALKVIRDKALATFQSKEYSNINVVDTRDDKGNTFLHYAMRDNVFSWCDMILKAGANPFIENTNGRNCFRVFRKYDDNSNFFKKYDYIRLDKYFNKHTEGFSQEFKQVLFEQKYKNFIEGHTHSEIERYLKSINLDSTKNRLLMIANNKMLKLDKKVKYYLENFDGSENNSFFLKQLCQSNLGKFVFKNKEIEADFFDRLFADNKNFHESISSIALFIESNNDYLESPLPQMIKIMFTQNFNLKSETGLRKETIEEYLMSKPLIKDNFLNEKLNKQLIDDVNRKSKAHKI